MTHRRGWVGLVFSACILMPAVASAQPRWSVTVFPYGGAPVYTGQCTVIWLRIIDLATDTQPRNPAGQLITIADFDMTVAGGGAVVGRYNGASMWSVCACPGSAGQVARITATYPAQSLPAKARVRGVTVSGYTNVTVVARTTNGMPIGCETVQTKTNPSGGTAPWTVILWTNRTPLPKGTCSPVWIDLRDETGKEPPRNSAGRLVAFADFHMAVTSGNGVVGQAIASSAWSACACQAATVGASATITATYPAKALVGTPQAVPGVGFESTFTIPVSAEGGTYGRTPCSVPAAPAPPPPPPTPTGQAPRNVTVTGNPVEAMVRWSPPVGPPNPTGYVVERWKAADPQCCRVTLVIRIERVP